MASQRGPELTKNKQNFQDIQIMVILAKYGHNLEHNTKIVVEEDTTMIKPKFHPGCIVQSYNN